VSVKSALQRVRAVLYTQLDNIYVTILRLTAAKVQRGSSQHESSLVVLKVLLVSVVFV
jgi:ligand-binding sensor domain-containing protein